MRLAIIGAVLLAAGAVAIATGALPFTDLVALVDRVAPILLFVVAMTVVTELCSEAGVFLWTARRLRYWGRGYSILLWLLLAAFATLSTVFLSLDTTAVLLTPVVVSVTRQAGLPALPFALTTVWLANTASLLLPISNLTNLLAQHSLGGITPGGFAGLMWAPSLAAVVVPLLFIAVVFRRDLRNRYSRIPVGRIRPDQPAGADSRPAADRVLLACSAVVLALLLPALVSGVPVWIPALAGAVVLGVVFALRRPRVLKVSLIPWSLLLFASGLFLVMEAARHLGAPVLLSQLAGQGQGFMDLVRLAATGAAGSNVLNNLPAYLLAEPLAGSPVRMAALLIGVNAGPIITPWASLATLLWHDRLMRMNVLITWKGYAIFGLIVAPLTVFAAVAVLAIAGQ
ncbi:SLC13 family permease [Arthrobacter bambusae]|jgi:arsenical pump membrane protein|uniref:Na+/H+ antiporter NhaD/arsenite permease-like protein n=3 Tax=Arthrobacter TaxID=1663 RepID=A0AAW8DIN1_9MICC|nr:SLC13 family permease [Arthrobacter bambusae]MDP9906634.1 Na+/H+ antiporter NhaD/arsenite permease-like protein [Arthrobacter bambusae]MDQ0130831.1 Na+/H+ antiporter NhaD/arsenite permease-like protein [Arthrobacter bambusae]MDQ0182312.1 Na+/H+ antiporter NhaD/arsenite permease-like protein [Arthrobacter bambusae]MDQ0241553.1 Na+/H+ antiporter NhaD/arsenite permease-like protein [Arthrobacter bambusae]